MDLVEILLPHALALLDELSPSNYPSRPLRSSLSSTIPDTTRAPSNDSPDSPSAATSSSRPNLSPDPSQTTPNYQASRSPFGRAASWPSQVPESSTPNSRHDALHGVARGLFEGRSDFRQPSTQSPTQGRQWDLAEGMSELSAVQEKGELEKQITRRWRKGDVYSPHDLSGVEMKKWKVRIRDPLETKQRRREAGKGDIFDELGIDPRAEYKNFALLSEFMTETGRIKHSSLTGLRPRNQRRVAKAIRRAVGIGIMPSVHKHPELIVRGMAGMRLR
ncbi:MAG: hypothetical protein M1820_008216 [Bogoriella megaspora]|nr:MAG: hypothetical protein M1820_008216 [Bogoriella megaspora]